MSGSNKGSEEEIMRDKKAEGDGWGGELILDRRVRGRLSRKKPFE